MPSSPRPLASTVRVASVRARRDFGERSLGRIVGQDPAVAIELAEQLRGLQQVARQLMRLAPVGSIGHHVGQVQQVPNERLLGRMVEKGCGSVRHRRSRPARHRHCAGWTSSGHARTGRSRPGSRRSASWPARCRSRCRCVGAREPKNQRAASAPISASSSSRLTNSPARLLMPMSSPSRTKRTQAISRYCTCSAFEAQRRGRRLVAGPPCRGGPRPTGRPARRSRG